ncbi:MAG: sigma-70 family RNA polymerase sigma factor [Bacteroidales bacterium]|jgi:RNA polymerase sigma-70 factor (ECF subfamily)|nr:sigma-70 family RNA polymerase sigma factor [Bacteroidales bacterium]
MTTEDFKENILPLNRKLLGFANRFMKDLDDAKDIVQEIYIKLWNMRQDLDQYHSVEALAMRMTRNLCLDKIKLNKTVPLNGFRKENIEDKHHVYEKKEELELAVKRVKDIIDHLEEPQKTIILLRDIEGYDNQEIAQILNMNVNTIRVNLSRTRKKIRDILLKKYYQHEPGKNKSSIREIL